MPELYYFATLLVQYKKLNFNRYLLFKKSALFNYSCV
jgi:hypothetical protein